MAMDSTCPACGKRFTVMWPHQWAFKRGNPAKPKYYCSWKCLRTLENNKGESDMKQTKITLEQKKKAVQIALEGGDPLKYLTEHGSDDAAQMWYSIKKKLKETDPETYAKLPKRIDTKPAETVVKDGVEYEKAEEPTLADAMTGMQDAADKFFGLCGGTAETPAEEEEDDDDDYITTAIRNKHFGEFYYDHDHGTIDWRTPDGDEVSLPVFTWKELNSELPRIMKKLGVEA